MRPQNRLNHKKTKCIKIYNFQRKPFGSSGSSKRVEEQGAK